jgi:hypothetical protein
MVRIGIGDVDDSQCREGFHQKDAQVDPRQNMFMPSEMAVLLLGKIQCYGVRREEKAVS